MRKIILAGFMLVLICSIFAVSADTNENIQENQATNLIKNLFNFLMSSLISENQITGYATGTEYSVGKPTEEPIIEPTIEKVEEEVISNETSAPVNYYTINYTLINETLDQNETPSEDETISENLTKENNWIIDKIFKRIGSDNSIKLYIVFRDNVKAIKIKKRYDLQNKNHSKDIKNILIEYNLNLDEIPLIEDSSKDVLGNGATINASSIKEKNIELAKVIDGVSIYGSKNKWYIDMFNDFSDLDYVTIDSEEPIIFKSGDYETAHKGIIVNDKKYAVHLLSCDQYSEKGCTFRINGVTVMLLDPNNNHGLSILDLDNKYQLKINSIKFDYCPEHSFCDLDLTAVDLVNISIIEKNR